MTGRLAEFADAIRAGAVEPRDERLLLDREGRIEVFYAPFDHVNEAPRIALVGITPGAVQARNALRSAREALRRGDSLVDAARQAKCFAGFSGLALPLWFVPSFSRLIANESVILRL